MDEKMIGIMRSLQEGLGSLHRVQEAQVKAIAAAGENAVQTKAILTSITSALDSVGRAMARLDERLSEVEKRLPPTS